jgi:hypothetical protein
MNWFHGMHQDVVKFLHSTGDKNYLTLLCGKVAFLHLQCRSPNRTWLQTMPASSALTATVRPTCGWRKTMTTTASCSQNKVHQGVPPIVVGSVNKLTYKVFSKRRTSVNPPSKGEWTCVNGQFVHTYHCAPRMSTKRILSVWLTFPVKVDTFWKWYVMMSELTPYADTFLKKWREAENSTFEKCWNLFSRVIRRLVHNVVRFAVFLFFWAIYPDLPRKWANVVPELSLYCVTFHCVLCYWCQSPDAQEQKICKILPTSYSRYET